MIVKLEMLKILTRKPYTIINILLPKKYMLLRDIQKSEFSQASVSNSELADEPPKRPLNPFRRFSKYILPELLKEHPDVGNNGAGGLFNVAANLWDSLDRQRKKKLYDSYYEDMEKYHFACLEYECKVNKQNGKEKISTRMTKRERRKLAELRTLSGKPKKPPNAFLLFLETQRGTKSEKSYCEFMKDCGVKYRNLSDDEKAVFQQKSKELQAAYKIAIFEWEDKVTKLGCAEILSKSSQFSKHFPEDDSF